MIEGASVTPGAEEAVIGYRVLVENGEEAEDVIAEANGADVNVLGYTRGEYTLQAYVEPSDKYYPAIATVTLKVLNHITPEALYMHGHFVDRYYDLMQPVVLTREEGTKIFRAPGIWIGGNEAITDGDFGWVFTSHVPEGANVSDEPGKPRLVAAHNGDWTALSNGYVYDKTGIKNAADITSQTQLTPFGGKAGIYDIEANFSNPEEPTFSATTVGDITTGIENVNAEAEGAVEYFNLQGVRVAQPSNGIFIRRQGGQSVVVRR